jgi:hypothetical protein
LLTFNGEEQHSALPLDHAAYERLAGHQGAGELERDETLVGAPLPAEQAVSCACINPLRKEFYAQTPADGTEREKTGYSPQTLRPCTGACL